jgi:hypothetical protein
MHSYTNCCNLHELPRDPTPHMLALYIAYTSHYINPHSIDTYLSGICNSLEPYYPYVRELCKHSLVVKAL